MKNKILILLFALSFNNLFANSDSLANFASTNLLSGIISTDTILSVTSGTGYRFPVSGYNITVWDASYYSSAANAYNSSTINPRAEIMRVTLRSGDTFHVIRAQEGTIAVNFNSANRSYQVAQTITVRALQSLQDSSLFVTLYALSGDTALTKMKADSIDPIHGYATNYQLYTLSGDTALTKMKADSIDPIHGYATLYALSRDTALTKMKADSIDPIHGYATNYQLSQKHNVIIVSDGNAVNTNNQTQRFIGAGGGISTTEIKTPYPAGIFKNLRVFTLGNVGITTDTIICRVDGVDQPLKVANFAIPNGNVGIDYTHTATTSDTSKVSWRVSSGSNGGFTATVQSVSVEFYPK